MNLAKRLADIINEQDFCFTVEEMRDIRLIIEALNLQNEHDVCSTNGGNSAGESYCVDCGNIVKSYQQYCDQCGQKLSWKNR